MPEDVAPSNVNRAYSLAGMSIAIFTFTQIFLYPRFVSGEANALLFQATDVVMGLATFGFVFATLFYYAVSLGDRMDEGQRALYRRRGDRSWLVGYTLLLLAPSLVLAAVGLYVVAAVWLALWLVYLIFVVRYFPRVQARLGTPTPED